MEKDKIKEIVSKTVEDAGYFLIDTVIRGDKNSVVIEVFIDNEEGITTTDCSGVTKEISSLIDSGNLINVNYRLDVSSPGVDRPLKFLPQYKKHLNRKFEIKFMEGQIEKKITGKLESISGDVLTFSDKKSEYSIPFPNIIEAQVLISF